MLTVFNMCKERDSDIGQYQLHTTMRHDLHWCKEWTYHEQHSRTAFFHLWNSSSSFADSLARHMIVVQSKWSTRRLSFTWDSAYHVNPGFDGFSWNSLSLIRFMTISKGLDQATYCYLTIYRKVQRAGAKLPRRHRGCSTPMTKRRLCRAIFLASCVLAR